MLGAQGVGCRHVGQAGGCGVCQCTLPSDRCGCSCYAGCSGCGCCSLLCTCVSCVPRCACTLAALRPGLCSKLFLLLTMHALLLTWWAGCQSSAGKCLVY